MARLVSFIRWLRGGARPASATSPEPSPPDVPLAAMEAARSRIAEAIAARNELDAATKASAAANIKGLYYMVLAARDLVRNDDTEAAAQVRLLLERASSGTASFAQDLRGLGEEGHGLARDLETAFAACREAIAARLPPVQAG
jgi:hypothetical protein